MTTTKTVTITILTTGLQVPHDGFASRVALRGEVLEIDREATLNRHGESWLDMTEADQLERWQEVKFALGDHSAGIKYLGEDDERITFRRREREEMQARRIADDAERRAEFERINKLYGPRLSSQRSASYGG